MVVSKQKFIESAVAWFERLLQKELPETNKDGQPFFEEEYIKQTWGVLIEKICHFKNVFGGGG